MIKQFGKGEEAGKTIGELRAMEGYNWCSDTPLSTAVDIYGAVICSGSGMLANVEDYVMTCDEDYCNVGLKISSLGFL